MAGGFTFEFIILFVLQTKLHTDFGYDDDFVIQTLEKCMEELRKAGLDLPPPATEIELPKKPFGVFVEPTVEAKVRGVVCDNAVISLYETSIFFLPFS